MSYLGEAIEALNFDHDGDTWGWATSAVFDIAAEIALRGDTVPAKWEYRPGACGPDKGEGPFADAIENVETSDLMALGSMIETFRAELDKAGLSY